MWGWKSQSEYSMALLASVYKLGVKIYSVQKVFRYLVSFKKKIKEFEENSLKSQQAILSSL